MAYQDRRERTTDNKILGTLKFRKPSQSSDFEEEDSSEEDARISTRAGGAQRAKKPKKAHTHPRYQAQGSTTSSYNTSRDQNQAYCPKCTYCDNCVRSWPVSQGHVVCEHNLFVAHVNVGTPWHTCRPPPPSQQQTQYNGTYGSQQPYYGQQYSTSQSAVQQGWQQQPQAFQYGQTQQPGVEPRYAQTLYYQQQPPPTQHHSAQSIPPSQQSPQPYQAQYYEARQAAQQPRPMPGYDSQSMYSNRPPPAPGSLNTSYTWS